MDILFFLCTPFIFVLTMIIATEFLNKNKIPTPVLIFWGASILGGITQAENIGHYFLIFLLLIVAFLIALKNS